MVAPPSLPKPVIGLPIPDGADTDAAVPAPDAGTLAVARKLLEFRKTLTWAQVQEELKLDAASARAILKHLVEEGLAVTEGKTGWKRYLQRKQREQH